MKLLCITDLHNSRPALERIVADAGRVDAVLLGGDITNFGSPDDAEVLVRLAQTAADRVNCDSAEIDSRLDALGVGLLGRGVIHDEIGFHGLSAMPPWRRRMYHFTEDQLAALLQEGYAQIAGATRHVVLSHAPPRNNKLDRTMFFENVGSVALRDFVDRTQPDLVICGHIHEGRGIGSMGKTTVVNCGPGAAGSHALVEVGETIQVELRRA
jgi:Icc-related predicted phosphoesterase